MVNKSLLAAKLSELDDRVQRVRVHVPAEAATLGTDRDALDLVAFNLMISVQICSDIASHVIADEGWAAARTLAEAFSRLREHGVVTPDVAEALKRAVGLRNVVAHGYAGIDVAMCHAAATTGLGDLSRFGQQVSEWALSQRDL